jgi:hypothetical protein
MPESNAEATSVPVARALPLSQTSPSSSCLTLRGGGHRLLSEGELQNGNFGIDAFIQQ